MRADRGILLIVSSFLTREDPFSHLRYRIEVLVRIESRELNMKKNI